MKIVKDDFGNIFIGEPKKFSEMTEEEKNEYIKKVDKEVQEFMNDTL